MAAPIGCISTGKSISNAAARAAPATIADAARLCADFARRAEAGAIPAMRFPERWAAQDGAGLTIGLIDGSIDPACPDLVGAEIERCDFVGTADHSASGMAHGTAMAQLLLGQGHRAVRGVVPRARLLAARAVGPGDVATSARVAAALDWLHGKGVHIIAMPIGSERSAPAIDAAIARIATDGVRLFAACGSGSRPLLYPACHPMVTAVGPCDEAGRLLPSARTAPRLDLRAPGGGIGAIWHAAAIGQGSSVATVLAAGAAALAAANKDEQ